MTRIDEKNGLEWTVFGIAVLLTLALLGYLLLAVARNQHAPPDLRATLGTAEQAHAGARIPVLVHNHGETPARGVEIEVRVPGRSAVHGRLTMDRVPADATRKGWVLLDIPLEQAAHARVHILGFEAP